MNALFTGTEIIPISICKDDVESVGYAMGITNLTEEQIDASYDLYCQLESESDMRWDMLMARCIHHVLEQ